MPASAFKSVTATSTVGVVESPVSITSTPIPIKVPTTRFETISPETLASLPKTIVILSLP